MTTLTRVRHDAVTPRLTLDHTSMPYLEALEQLATEPWQRIHVPAHQAHPENAPGLARIVGEHAMKLDFPMLFSGIDQTTWRAPDPSDTPLQHAQRLAADAWGASRTWFITNGASGGNHIATTVARGLGRELVVQRSVHSSVIDGIVHGDLLPHFVTGRVDTGIGAANGVTAEQIAEALDANPRAGCVYIVTPSYFGAVADVRAIADVAHEHGVPLIVDEAWGSHFGFHPRLPVNAARQGADLVISSTHKGAGSLTQSAMLHLGHGPFARALEPLVDRVVRSYQSTSCSPLLLASLDAARHHLMVEGHRVIPRTLDSIAEVRAGLERGGRFRDASALTLSGADAIDLDPCKIVIDLREAGIGGAEAQHLLVRDHRVAIELSTPTAIVLLVGVTSPIDADRILTALHALPRGANPTASGATTIPAPCEQRLAPADAFFADVEVVKAEDAVGRVSADSLAAYPPGVPNVLPGEVLNPEVIGFLRMTASSPAGHVRGSYDRSIDHFRVVRER